MWTGEQKLQNNVKDELLDEEEETEEKKKEESPKKNFRYYFNRFRYYHYYYTVKIETFITVIIIWIIKIQLYFLGYRVDGFPSFQDNLIPEIEE